MASPETVVTRELGVRAAPLPIEGPFPPLFALVAAHGGSGAGTLARLWAPAATCGQAWPANPATTQRVLVVAREHMAGIAAAAEVLRAADRGWIPAGVVVHGFITVAAHPGKTHKDVRRYAHTIGELVTHSYRIAWVPSLITTLPGQLPTWRPDDGVQITRRSAAGDLATTPSSIAAVGQQICTDLAADCAVPIDPALTGLRKKGDVR